jgi:hypothetical protein
MTRSDSFRRRALMLAAASGLALGLTSAAHAFQFDSAEGVTGGQSSIVDPDARFGYSQNGNGNGNGSNSDGKTTIQNGNATLQFGSGGSGAQNYNPNNMFNPYYRDGR